MSTNKRRGLGRGLDALLSNTSPTAPDNAVPAQPHAQSPTPAPPAAPQPTAAVADEVTLAVGERLAQLPVDLLQRGKYQPRHLIQEDSLQELAASIRAQGIVQPILVRPIAKVGGEQRYEIIAGERRWRAAQLAGLNDVPAVVREIADESAIAMALIENIQRENLNPLEESLALQRLIDEFAMTHQSAAEAVGRSRAAVSNLLRLLDLHAELKPLVETGQLSMGHARALLALEGRQQLEAGRKVAAKKLSVRATETLVRNLLKATPAPVPQTIDPNVRQLQAQLSDYLAAAVTLQSAAGGKGKLIVNYSSLDELDGILQKMGLPASEA